MHASSQAIRLSGTSNFRDLGGHIGQDGRHVRSGLLFRSDNLARLNVQDHQVLRTLGIQTTIDFRARLERQRSSYEITGVTQHNLPIEPILIHDIEQALQNKTMLSAQQVHESMEQTYRSFVTQNQQQYQEFFQLLLKQPLPQIFHCTAGKDRTGFAAALLLDALGVSRASIMQDYLLTNDLYKRPAHSVLALDTVLTPDALQILWKVHPDYLSAAIDSIEAGYGSLAAYREKALSLTPQDHHQLQCMYLTESTG